MPSKGAKEALPVRIRVRSRRNALSEPSMPDFISSWRSSIMVCLRKTLKKQRVLPLPLPCPSRAGDEQGPLASPYRRTHFFSCESLGDVAFLVKVQHDRRDLLAGQDVHARGIDDPQSS